MTSSVLVTGGAGYIGSHTVRALRARGDHVVVLDTLELGNADFVGDAALVVGDIADHDLVVSTCREHEVDAVVHFAAYKSVGESMQAPGKYFANNVDGSRRLIDAVLAADVGRFVFSSSCSVYGTPTSVPVAEREAIAPESVYAESKAMVERLLHWYGLVTDLRSVSLRYFNAAGASFDATIGEDWTHSINLVPVALRALLTGDQELQVFGDDYDTPDGSCIRDYIHVEDLATAHLAALDHLARGGASAAVNLGTGVGSSVLDVIGAIERISGRKVPYRVAPRRSGDPVSTYADPSGARDLLGWEARHDLDEIIESALRWHEARLTVRS